VEFGLSTGTFDSTLDEKGRVVIPSSLRDRYQGELVITQGRESCVWIMTKTAYKYFREKLKEQAETMTYDEKMAFLYLHIGSAKTAEVDPKSGRIQIPPTLRTYANLSKECYVLSIDGHLEVWNVDSFRQFMNEMQTKAKRAMKKLGDINFFPEEELS
jgi:MraZ protein